MKKINIKILTLIGVLFLIILVSNCTASADPGTRTARGLNTQVTVMAVNPTVTETGKVNLSVDGLGTLSDTGTIQVQKPQDATVKKAYLIAASTGFSGDTIANGDVKINGQDVNWIDKTPSAISSYNYWADVTSIVKPIVDSAPAGLINLDITELKTYEDDGEVLAVIFDDPNQKTDNTIILLFGAQDTEGDTFSIRTAQPIDLTNPNLAIDMGLGISYGYQQGGGDQYSLINVDDKRLTTSAGGEDDGDDGNGALLTVGGIGDSNDNPIDPYATPTNPSSDDELYNLLPFVSQGDTKISVYTQNPSMDDNIFFGYFDFKSTEAIVGEGIVLSPPTATTNLGDTDTVVATVQDDNGNPIVGATVTFEITDGPNKGKDSTATTDVNGTATFSYTGMTAGTDTIVASFINSQGAQIISNQVTNTWINNLPVANFSAEPTSGNAPLKVQFTDDSTGSPTSWKWSFGDVKTSPDQNPVHTYSKAGSYTVSLTVKNAAGSNTTTKLNFITVTSVKPSYAYITNTGDNTVSVIDTATNKVTSTVSIGRGSWGVAVNPAGTKVYVANRGSGTVSVIDTATNKVTATLKVKIDANGVAVTPDGKKVYVTNSASNDVSVIDTATNKVTGTFKVGKGASGVAVTPDGKKAYVVNIDSHVSVIDTTTNKVKATVKVGNGANGANGVAVTPDGKKVYVTNSGFNSVSVIDTEKNKVTATLKVGNNPTGVAVNPAGTKVYVANRGDGTVSVIDAATNKVTSTVKVGSYPFGVSVTSDGTKVYVANSGSNSVSVIDTATNKVTATVPVGSKPIAFGQFICL